jgi:N-acetyl-anhydromuramyl-L-alanine amidase AmpD
MSSNKLDIQKIVQHRLKKGQFFEEVSDKTQIYLHHTAGNGNAEGVARFWNSNESQIATAFVIGENGTIVQCFSSKHWGWHLGIDNEDFSRMGSKYKNLNKLSVGIEVCNWGMLKEKNGKFYNYVGGVVNPSYVTTLEEPYKGYKHWYRYTDAQIESTRQLVEYLCETYGIPNTYRKEIWSLDKAAFDGEKGIFTHNSVRKDKADIYPCPRMIKMLQSL